MIAVFAFLLVAVAAFIFLWNLQSRGATKDRMEALINEKFLDFAEHIHKIMDQTRQEVARSKDAVTEGTIKTLSHLSDMNKVMNELIKQQEKAQELGQSLEYLLQSPKLRGSYGEAILEEMLDKVLPKGIWLRQYMIEGGEKVDAVIKYKDVVIPIDAKFPKEDYQKYLAATDPELRKKYWQDYERALKVQINSIREKYIKPDKGTSEFALLFIPSEAIYYETIAEKNNFGEPCQIYTYATERKVVPVSPNTFYAFLNIIVLGIRNVEIAKEARKIQERLSKLEKDFSFFYSNFEEIGRLLDKAARSHETGKVQVLRFKKNLDSVVGLEIGQEAQPSMKELPRQ
ncbi:MAG: DNA recombination protein RmuC [Candidatus Omnitrophica bacterium]|nr:DNA recombination protein RmuC [Candidatus Omnitrophota bacterium]